MTTFEYLVPRIAQMISFGLTVGEIREMLLREGCSEEEAYLFYVAARIYEREE